jgi:NAD-dependent deacetylase
LEQHLKTSVVTQNIDGLHQSAGSTDVHEIHGSLLEVFDSSTAQVIRRFERNDLAQIAETLRQYATHQISLFSLLRQLRKEYPFDWLGRHRPNLVLFGDAMAEPAWTEARRVVDQCDLLLSVGTSGAVYPAAMLPDWAAGRGAAVVTIDPHPNGDCPLAGNAGAILPKLISDVFGAGVSSNPGL